jgi:PQQ-like domain
VLSRALAVSGVVVAAMSRYPRAMSQLTSGTCARCGAPLKLDPAAPKQVCAFCGNEHVLSQAPSPQPFPQQPFPQRPFPQQPFPRPPVQEAAPLGSAAPAAGLLVGVVLAITVIVAAGVFAMKSRGRGNAGAMPGGGGAVPAGEHLQWSSNGTSVVPARIDGDAVEDFVGRYVILDIGGDSSQTLFVGGFSGATFERAWKAGPYGTLSDGVGATHLAVAGDRIAVTDYRLALHVLDAATGKELRTLRLSDRARDMCSPTDARKQVWIEVADGNNLVVDLDAGKAESAAKRPAWCRGGASHECAGTRAACSDDRNRAPKQAGFGTDLVFSEGNVSVAVGHKEPGTRTPMALGFDASRGAVAWTATIPADPTSVSGMPDPSGDLAEGRFYTSYSLGSQKGSRLVSFDARSGARRWDVEVPRGSAGSGVEGLTATATRVYVPHWTWIDVFEAGSGKLLGTVGIW